MPNFRVSQGELWSRTYIIEADTLEQAKEIYARYGIDLELPDNVYMYSPDYVDDIDDDVVWYDEKGNIMDELKDWTEAEKREAFGK